MFTRKKENKFNTALQTACGLEKEALAILFDYFKAGKIAQLITVEHAEKLAEHHEALMQMYKLAAKRDFVCDCCRDKVRRGEITLHIDGQPTLTS